MVWYCITIHRGPPPLIKAHFSHFRWQLRQIACHFAYIWQNKWLVPTTLAQPAYLRHNSSLFAAIQICLFGLRRYCKSCYCFGICACFCGCRSACSCCSCSTWCVSMSLLFTSLYTKICHCVERPCWQVTMPLAEGGPHRTSSPLGAEPRIAALPWGSLDPITRNRKHAAR